MKKKIAILGSTGSIGKSTIEILKRDKKNLDIILLTTNNNYKEDLKSSWSCDTFFLKIERGFNS